MLRWSARTTLTTRRWHCESCGWRKWSQWSNFNQGQFCVFYHCSKNVFSSSYIFKSGPFENVVLFLSLLFLLYLWSVKLSFEALTLYLGTPFFFVHAGPGHHKMLRKMCRHRDLSSRVVFQCVPRRSVELDPQITTVSARRKAVFWGNWDQLILAMNFNLSCKRCKVPTKIIIYINHQALICGSLSPCPIINQPWKA